VFHHKFLCLIHKNWPDGAALFYTTPLPSTLQVLRQYALHLLFTPPAPPPGVASGPDATAPIRNPFPFQHKPNILDRDRILVPAGWDSWGKITVMRDGFDAKMWGEAWERDLESVGEEASDDLGARKLFAALVPDRGTKVRFLPRL
jgi:dynein light intermediate chain 1